MYWTKATAPLKARKYLNLTSDQVLFFQDVYRDINHAILQKILRKKKILARKFKNFQGNMLDLAKEAPFIHKSMAKFRSL